VCLLKEIHEVFPDDEFEQAAAKGAVKETPCVIMMKN
jgi:hypothetical protein